MSTPLIPNGIALFANQPQTTVSNGGTTAPAQGTSEQWTVSSSASFPPASNTSVPNTSFCVADTAATTEIISVTAVTGTVWGVTRGAQSTTPVTHASNFTVQQVVTGGDLNNFQQLRNGGNTSTTVATGAGAFTMSSFAPAPTDIPAAGVVYDFNASGVFSNTAGGGACTFATIWNGTTLASVTVGTSPNTMGLSMTTSSFWMEGRVSCYGSTTMVSGFNVQISSYTNSHGAFPTLNAVAANSGGITISGTGGPLVILANKSAANPMTVSGFLVHRIS